jgi:hypothetical protein
VGRAPAKARLSAVRSRITLSCDRLPTCNRRLRHCSPGAWRLGASQLSRGAAPEKGHKVFGCALRPRTFAFALAWWHASTQSSSVAEWHLRCTARASRPDAGRQLHCTTLCHPRVIRLKLSGDPLEPGSPRSVRNATECLCRGRAHGGVRHHSFSVKSHGALLGRRWPRWWRSTVEVLVGHRWVRLPARRPRRTTARSHDACPLSSWNRLSVREHDGVI